MTPNLPVVFAVLPGIVVGLLLPLAIVGLVAYGIFELVRAGSDRPVDGTGARVAPAASNPAIAILEERFARGEIESEDYLQRRELLLAAHETTEAASPAQDATAEHPSADDRPPAAG
jgi:hypothetical protein